MKSDLVTNIRGRDRRKYQRGMGSEKRKNVKSNFEMGQCQQKADY